MLSSSPTAVTLANNLVNGVTLANNMYSYNAPVVTFAGVNGTTYYNSSDCSSFQDVLMMEAYGYSLTQLEAWTKVTQNGTSYPQSAALYTAAVDHDGFTGFSQIADLQVGDDIFVDYLEGDANGDTGHCMMVNALPTLAFSNSSGRGYDLQVLDCTSDPHSHDTRINGATGVGRGYIEVYTDTSGNLTSWSWGEGTSIYPSTQRPAIFSKMPPMAGNTFMAAGSQATWNASNDSLVVTGPAAIIADPTASQQPAVTITGTGAQLLMMPAAPQSVVHLASLTMTSYATATMYAPDGGQLLLDIAADVGNGVVSIDSTSKLDLAGDDMIVHGGSLSAISSLISRGYNNGNWLGNGITSSSAGNDTAHLTALGAIYNTNGSTALYPTFDGVSSNTTDVIVRHTYYGDANLSGTVDGSDYSDIDNGFLSRTLTGWYNGDFNNDGVVNGSDYTLIDNAYNTQGSQLVFSPQTQIAANPPAAKTISALPPAGDTSAVDSTFESLNKKKAPGLLQF